MERENIIKIIDERIKLKAPSDSFTARKVTDTPTDALSVVPRKYVTMNGNTASRPTSSVVGQFYLDTDLGMPVWWDGTGFIDAQGNYV